MRLQLSDTNAVIHLSARDTYDWANRPGERWPCSQLSNKRVMACFDRNGLYDLTINGRDGDCDVNEFNAIISDNCRKRVPENHPLRSILVQP
jgi:hypothetical protein